MTHVELLPAFDFASVDENNPSFNWGYDPQNYNVPEGSYSSDPTNPVKRIAELKSAIQALHNLGLRVKMDVVYNHVYSAPSFSENQIVPGYFFRTDNNGNLTNGSGTGNDVASERSMVRKFIVDSVSYWAGEYNFDGFRFDLMGLMDIDSASRNGVQAGISGNTAYSNLITTKWMTISPGQSVNYVESHDNLTLADKIASSVANSTPTQIGRMARFASSIALLAQGLPFIQAGQEFLRSKNGDENSYKSSDAVNSIKWSTKASNLTTYKYFQGLIALRRAHPAFRMTTTAQVIKSLKFYAEPNNVLMYSLAGKAVGDKVASFVVIHNPNTNVQMIKLPKAGKWSIVVAGEKAGTSVISTGYMREVRVEAQSTMVLQQ